MGRPPLNNTVMNLNLDPSGMRRVSEIVGNKGISKFVRDLVRRELDHVAPGEEKAGPPYIDSDGGHEPRLSVSGRATVFAILRKQHRSLDQMQQAFGIADPIDFIHVLLGHKPLPNKAAAVLVTELLGSLWDKR